MRSIPHFLVYSIALGLGLSADAFSVSIVNGIKWPDMKRSKAITIAGSFAFFQAMMPMLGWALTHTMLEHFHLLARILPPVSQFFLLYLGVKLILESKNPPSGANSDGLMPARLLLQSLATSVDALLVGLALASFSAVSAAVCSLIIAAVTFFLCFPGVQWGQILGLKSARKSMFIGGCVLVLIALIH